MLLYEKREENVVVDTWTDMEFIPHLHHHLELIICMQGTAIATCRGRTETLYPGDVMLACSNDIHSYSRSSGSGLIVIMKPGVFPLIAEKLSRRRYDNFLLNRDETYIRLAQAILRWGHQEPDWITLCGCIYTTMGLLLQQLSWVPAEKNESQDLFSSVLAYVSEHYTQPLSLKALAEQFHVNPYHLSRLFSSHFPEGFLRYLHELRIGYARYLLEHTSYPIGDILYRSGFTDQKTFNRVFLQLTGQTPRDFRRSLHPET